MQCLYCGLLIFDASWRWSGSLRIVGKIKENGCIRLPDFMWIDYDQTREESKEYTEFIRAQIPISMQTSCFAELMACFQKDQKGEALRHVKISFLSILTSSSLVLRYINSQTPNIDSSR